MSNQTSTLFRVVSTFVVLTALASCNRHDPDVLARFDGGRVTVADLDQQVRSLPEAQRVLPDGEERERWLEQRLRELAVERVMAVSPPVVARLASPELSARRRWSIISLLAGGVIQQLAAQATPSEQQVAEHLATVQQQPQEPLLTFRHLYLRLDQAGSDRNRREVRELGDELARRARSGEDFEALVREHSESADAATGGLVKNQRLSLLEGTVRDAIAGMVENEVSPLVESRSGLHVFKLERRLEVVTKADEAAARAAAFARREALQSARQTLIEELRLQIPVDTSTWPWKIGQLEVSEEELELSGAPADEPQQRLLVEQLLLAEEGRRRGLLTAELEQSIDMQLRAEAIASQVQVRQAERLAGLGEDVLRPLYDERPSAFMGPPDAHLDLIFVPQGPDPLATHRRLEAHLAELRAGASFADLAHEISQGPGAADGGDLGYLPAGDWVRLSPAVHTAVQATEVGEITEPVLCSARVLTNDPRALRGGFAIIRVRDKRPARERSFAEAIDDVRHAYARTHAEELAQQLQASILDEAGFEIVRLPESHELLQ